MLKKFAKFNGFNGPVLTIVMDGVGCSANPEGNAVSQSYTPTLDRLLKDYPNLLLTAHGTAVGLPTDDDMGNSEVGHNALGAGQVYSQGAKLVSESIASGQLFDRPAWKELTGNCAANGTTLHLIGLFSDGNVHSHIDHLKALIARAKQEGVRRVRIHILLDGRDVGETSALEYVDPFEGYLSELRSADFDVRIASGGGRMKITMDRYGANWGMVELGWRTHVLAEGKQFPSAHEAIVAYRAEARVIDQDLPPFVIAENGQPVGPINDGDSVIFFNFRGDRAIEISKAFEDDNFPYFDRVRRPKVVYAGMLEYDGDLHIPKRYLVSPPEIRNTMGEYLARTGVSQLAISETQKFGHVTYFWNGNRSGKFDEQLETYIEITSDQIPFEQRPWMKGAEITDQLIAELKTGKYRYARVNFPNGDMVGHTGDYEAARIAVETVDLCLGRILLVLDELGGMAIITADHGNADEMFELDKKGKPLTDKSGRIKAKTSHTLNPVPCIFYDNQHRGAYEIVPGKYGLANLAATTANLLGYEAPEMWEQGILRFK
ncbi:phosphoglycerate mutase [Hydrogenispora ethanolica]|uniref:2,3-bisphosphoglycerate-independent phosphoglycerate mutase n=1 Tax=Hydrogenispora ethanolica TaxID=1082276 RepID=A0A4R1RHB3_HYDET|nr:2,3-bisphosphoglycerate-independent phosphoglycerate mutase [Hydrogenispora ethanolica]TCL65309.1 phosphoglycerate mutase [Hydrogenispora ethanolica]